MFLRFLTFLVGVRVLVCVEGRESAWNGRITPGSDKPSFFLPYYVPPGAKSYDSASPLIHFSGKWSDAFSSAFVQKTLRWTEQINAYAQFTFSGTAIEWFGNMDTRHGTADVFIDGQHVKTVDAWSKSPMRQQRLYWNYDLAFGKHTIRIVNTGSGRGRSGSAIIDIDAFIVTKGPNPGTQLQEPAVQPFAGTSDLLEEQKGTLSQKWTLIQRGSTGVHAMQLAVISPSHAIVIDKVEHNPLTISGHPAWGALYNLKTHAVKPLAMQSNSFCAGGSFLSNGTLINVGGNPVVATRTSSADFGDLDGLQAVRMFDPCDSEVVDDCDIYENHSRLRLASPRWYNTVIRISDGSAMIIGGSKKGGWINNATVNNPTLEYWPPKSIHGSHGLPIDLPFLVDTLRSNLFPIAFALPDGKIFMAANQDAMIYDWENNVEKRLPQIPNGVRVTYPMAGSALLLPLSPQNGYIPEILICGGSTLDDSKPSYAYTSQEPASAQCSRMVLTDDGILTGWLTEQMPVERTMADAVLLPTGQVLLVNGARTGISGYGNVINQVGQSNADNPVLKPTLYDPLAPFGQRYLQQGMPSSSIPRLYHSVATLTPDGDVMIAGSNPNLDRSEMRYGTEYRVEWLRPTYMEMERPLILNPPKAIAFGQTALLQVSLPASAENADIKVALMDLGFVTHAVHANSRMVYLLASLSNDGQKLSVTAPPNGKVYPPGPGWIYVVVDGIPSVGAKVMIGDGNSPPVDQEALNNLLETTLVDQYEVSKKGKKSKKKKSKQS